MQTPNIQCLHASWRQQLVVCPAARSCSGQLEQGSVAAVGSARSLWAGLARSAFASDGSRPPAGRPARSSGPPGRRRIGCCYSSATAQPVATANQHQGSHAPAGAAAWRRLVICKLIGCFCFFVAARDATTCCACLRRRPLPSTRKIMTRPCCQLFPLCLARAFCRNMPVTMVVTRLKWPSCRCPWELLASANEPVVHEEGPAAAVEARRHR